MCGSRTAAAVCLLATRSRLTSSAVVVDQAIGVLVALGRISPADGFAVLREVSQRTTIRLSALATDLVPHCQGSDLPESVQTELRAHAEPSANTPAHRRPAVPSVTIHRC
ncbi:hypothetical protein RKD37_000332 [Streptomyces ambofaciens]|uniref:ANTAR domain-containing protein n=1 Tax=unclassified Streptomyces TaxID=2593676 RepID=UPI0033F33220